MSGGPKVQSRLPLGIMCYSRSLSELQAAITVLFEAALRSENRNAFAAGEYRVLILALPPRPWSGISSLYSALEALNPQPLA